MKLISQCSLRAIYIYIYILVNQIKVVMKPTVGYGSVQIFRLKYQGALQWFLRNLWLRDIKTRQCYHMVYPPFL